MRCYSFTNYYLSDIQKGIQSGHSNVELSLLSKEQGVDLFFEWAKNHKTVIILNGGNQAQLQTIYSQLIDLSQNGMNLPFAKFHEDEQSLNGALTSISIIVPEVIYENAQNIRLEKQLTHSLNDWQFGLINILNSYVLA